MYYAELHRSGFSVCSSVDFFCDFGKFLELFIPVLFIWYLEIISCYLRGRTILLISQGRKGEWELRATSICNNPEEPNSISPARPVHFSPELIGRKIGQMSPQDKQKTDSSYIAVLSALMTFSPPTKAMPVNNINFGLLAQKHKYRCEGLDLKLEFQT